MTTFKHLITKFRQCGPLTLLTHLYTEYRIIASSNLTSKSDCMTVRWNPPTLISDLFQHLDDRKEFTEEVNERINDSQLICLCYYNVHASRLFNKTLKTW